METLIQKCSCLAPGDSLEQFEWFELLPCLDVSDDPNETDIQVCDAGWAEFWTIYGRVAEGPAEGLAYAVHDAYDPASAVAMAVAISLATGKGFRTGDEAHGLMPREPETNFVTIAEWLTDTITDDLPDLAKDDWARVDDFENHPLADLREAFVDHSDYAGIREVGA